MPSPPSSFPLFLSSPFSELLWSASWLHSALLLSQPQGCSFSSEPRPTSVLFESRFSIVLHWDCGFYSFTFLWSLRFFRNPTCFPLLGYPPDPISVSSATRSTSWAVSLSSSTSMPAWLVRCIWLISASLISLFRHLCVMSFPASARSHLIACIIFQLSSNCWLLNHICQAWIRLVPGFADKMRCDLFCQAYTILYSLTPAWNSVYTIIKTPSQQWSLMINLLTVKTTIGLCGRLFVVCFLCIVCQTGDAGHGLCLCIFMYLASFLIFTCQRINLAFLLFQCSRTIPVDQLLYHQPPTQDLQRMSRSSWQPAEFVPRAGPLTAPSLVSSTLYLCPTAPGPK